MEKYYFTKNINSEVLVEAIQLRTSLRSIFDHCNIRVEADGSVKDDNIEIHFSRALLSAEIDEITNVVNAIGPTYDLMIRKNIENNTMNWAIKMGQTILAQFGANNLYYQKDDAQVDALVEGHPDLIHALVTGSLTKAYREFLAMQPDVNISQEEIDEFRLRLLIILGG